MLKKLKTLEGLKNIQALLIDLDGTMVNTLGDFTLALNLALAEMNLGQITHEFIARTVGKGTEHLLKSVLAHQGHQGANLDLYPEFLSCYERHYLSINGQASSVYPEVRESLERWRAQGLELVCLTNKPLAFTHPLLEQKGLREFFTLVFGGDSFREKKPHPMPLLEACSQLGFAPQNCLMLGDSSNDAKAARAAGCPIVLMRYGYNHGDPIDQVPALAHLDSFSQLQINTN